MKTGIRLATGTIATIATLLLLAPSGARAQLTPAESLATLRTAEGLEVTLFTAEPDLVNPTAMDVDSAGRVWVTEAANYRVWKNPVFHEQGDRVRVLEDTDGDGKADKAWTFYQDESLQAPLGIAVLGDRVYICQSPDLFYLQDTDGDGVADMKTVILTGFKGVDHDHAIHGVMFGPDGLLYMSNGDRGLDVTDKSGRRLWVGQGAPVLAATVLRTDLEGYRLELLSQGMRNPYEPTVDSFGNVFISDNDDDGNEQTRINYVMEGGHYGYWPRRKGDRHLDSVHWNEDLPGVVPKMIKTGFGSPTGILFYEGDQLPERLRRTLIHADAGPGVVRSYRPQPKGAGYKADLEVLLHSEGDGWFRPSDVTTGPDGSVFVADWYDPGVGGHNMRDHERGRIYRLAAKGDKQATASLDLDSGEGIAEAFASPNLARRFLGYKALEELGEAGDWEELETLHSSSDPVIRSRALWLLARNDTRRDDAARTRGAEALAEATRDPRPESRVLAVRILASLGPDRLAEAEPLLDDPDAAVRRQILVELARLEDEPAWAGEWITRLARSYDGEDRFYREAIGIAARGREDWLYGELTSGADGASWNAKMAGLAIQLHPAQAEPAASAALADAALPIDARAQALLALDAIGSPEAGARIFETAVGSGPDALKDLAMGLLARDEGDVWREAIHWSRFEAALGAGLADPRRRARSRATISEMRLAEFVPGLIDQAADPALELEARLASMRTAQGLAGRVNRSRFELPRASFTALLADGEAALRDGAMDALVTLRTDEAFQLLREVIDDAARPRAQRERAVRQLARTRSGGALVLDMAETGELPADLTLVATERLNASRYEEIRLMAAQVLPREITREGEALPPLAELLAMRGDGARGHEVFFSEDRSQCFRCHRVAGEGREVGPDLTRIGSKSSREALFESILNPSAAISQEYEVWIVRTKSRGYLTGYIRTERSGAIELIDAEGETQHIDANQIVERRKSTTSLMPAGLASGVTAQELVDLVDYLSALK